MIKLADVKEAFSRFLAIKDEHGIDMILASVVGNLLIDRDPVWLMLIAPSSGGKTALISPLAAIPSVHFCDDLTEKTLLSGYKVKGREMSLLKVIGSGMICISDYTAILSKNPMSRSEILGQLRMVYDGNFVKRTGTGTITWGGKIGMCAGCTPDIYTLLESARSAGERYIYYWLEQPTDDEIVDKQQQVELSAKEITSVMKEFYSGYYSDITKWVEVNGIPPLSMTPKQRLMVRRAAIFCVNGKAVVRTDFKSGKPDAIPNKASVGRDAKMFDTILHTLQLMNCYEQDDTSLPVEDWMVEVVEKCAYSSINRERRKILEILVNSPNPLTGSQIGAYEGLGLEKESAEKYLIPLHSVGLVKKMTSGGRGFTWYIDNPETIDLVRRVSKNVAEAIYVPGIDMTNEPEPEVTSGDLLEEYELQNERLMMIEEEN